MAPPDLEVAIKLDSSQLDQLADRVRRADARLRRQGLRGVAGAFVVVICHIRGRGRRLEAKLTAIVTHKPERYRTLSTYLTDAPVEELLA